MVGRVGRDGYGVMESAPKCEENLDGGITHDACLPSFHHGTYPRRLNCQVFTNGRFCIFFIFIFIFIFFIF